VQWKAKFDLEVSWKCGLKVSIDKKEAVIEVLYVVRLCHNAKVSTCTLLLNTIYGFYQMVLHFSISFLARLSCKKSIRCHTNLIT